MAWKCFFAFLSVTANTVVFLICFRDYGAVSDWPPCHYKSLDVTRNYELLFYMGVYLYGLALLMSLISLISLCCTGLSLVSACLNGPIAFAQLIFILSMGILRFKASGAYCSKMVLLKESGGVTFLFVMVCVLGWTNLCSI